MEWKVRILLLFSPYYPGIAAADDLLHWRPPLLVRGDNNPELGLQRRLLVDEFAERPGFGAQFRGKHLLAN